jgi:hypothetical protein
MGSGKEPGPTYQEHRLGQVALAYAPCMGVIQCTRRSPSTCMPMQCTRRAAHHQGCWTYTPALLWARVVMPEPSMFGSKQCVEPTFTSNGLEHLARAQHLLGNFSQTPHESLIILY